MSSSIRYAQETYNRLFEDTFTSSQVYTELQCLLRCLSDRDVPLEEAKKIVKEPDARDMNALAEHIILEVARHLVKRAEAVTKKMGGWLDPKSEDLYEAYYIENLRFFSSDFNGLLACAIGLVTSPVYPNQHDPSLSYSVKDAGSVTVLKENVDALTYEFNDLNVRVEEATRVNEIMKCQPRSAASITLQ